jgi:hypothetical protein
VTRRRPSCHVSQAQSHFLWCEDRKSLHVVYKGSFGLVLHSAKVSPSRAPLALGGSQVQSYPYLLLSNETHTQSSLISKQVIPYRTHGDTCCSGGSSSKKRSLADFSKNHPQTMKVTTFPTISRHCSNPDVYQLWVHSHHRGWKTTNHHSSTYNKSNDSILKL